MCGRDELAREANDQEWDLAAATEELRAVAAMLRGFVCELGGPVLGEDLGPRRLCDFLGEAINLRALEGRRRDALEEDRLRELGDVLNRLGQFPRGMPFEIVLLQINRRLDRLLIEHADRGALLAGRVTHA